MERIEKDEKRYVRSRIRGLDDQSLFFARARTITKFGLTFLTFQFIRVIQYFHTLGNHLFEF